MPIETLLWNAAGTPGESTPLRRGLPPNTPSFFGGSYRFFGWTGAGVDGGPMFSPRDLRASAISAALRNSTPLPPFRKPRVLPASNVEGSSLRKCQREHSWLNI